MWSPVGVAVAVGTVGVDVAVDTAMGVGVETGKVLVLVCIERTAGLAVYTPGLSCTSGWGVGVPCGIFGLWITEIGDT